MLSEGRDVVDGVGSDRGTGEEQHSGDRNHCDFPNGWAFTRLFVALKRLAEAAGSNGMIGGQMIDMQAAQNAFGADEIVLLQRLKTGQLFEFSCEAGAILGEAKQEDRDRLRSYARDMGLVFQITDDLLDVTSTAEKTGKAVGKDKEQGKATLVAILGIDGARSEAEKLARRAAATLAPYGNAAPELCALPLYLLNRDS